jgi:hypothetical protein
LQITNNLKPGSFKIPARPGADPAAQTPDTVYLFSSTLARVISPSFIRLKNKNGSAVSPKSFLQVG